MLRLQRFPPLALLVNNTKNGYNNTVSYQGNVMAQLVQDDQGRYQNVSHMLLSVQKINPRTGAKSYALKPGQVVSMTGEEVQASKDTHRFYEKNPFDVGLIQKIPEGKTQHPDLPNFGKHPKPVVLEEAMKDGDIKKLKKLASNIHDPAGIVLLNRVLITVESALNKKVTAEIEHVIDQTSERVERELNKLKNHYELLLGE